MFAPKIRLRRAAIQLAAHGWPVTPGAYLRERSGTVRFDCGRSGCPTTGCHPALPDWDRAASRDPLRVAQWWRQAPCAVLLPTGLSFDVLELPAAWGRIALRSWGGPVAASPTGRWMCFVRPSEAPLPELAERPELLLHQRGSWVPAPPSRLAEGPVRWVIPPAAVGWRLSNGYALQRLIAGTLVGTAGFEPATSRL
jgi:hypothetical protein